MGKWFSDILMRLSPHDEDKLDANTDNLRRDIQERAETREMAKRESKDYIELQLEILRRK